MRPARCRWIDDDGDEWLFSREHGTLIVERPARMESVVIRFPDPSTSSDPESLGGTWVMLETADGNIVHCSICPGVRPMEVPDLTGSLPNRDSEAESGEDAPTRSSDHQVFQSGDGHRGGGGTR